MGGSEEIIRFLNRLGLALVYASLLWLFYLALEPYLRRLWPQTIVSWVRLLDGRFRDPLVGRDVLLGLLAGILFALLNRLAIIGPAWLGLPSVRPDQFAGPPIEMFVLTGLRSAVGLVFSVLSGSLVVPMGILVLLLLTRIALRRTWLAVLAIAAVIPLSGAITTGNLYVDFCIGAAGFFLHVLLLFRVGVLAIIVAEFAGDLLSAFPMTFDTGSWLFGLTLLALGILAALAVFGFRIALAGRPAIGGDLLPEVRSV
jgi:hypothetical protein